MCVCMCVWVRGVKCRLLRICRGPCTQTGRRMAAEACMHDKGEEGTTAAVAGLLAGQWWRSLYSSASEEEREAACINAVLHDHILDRVVSDIRAAR